MTPSSTFGGMRIEFTADEPGSVVVSVRARIVNRADLDTLIQAIEASRQLLSEAP